MHMGERFLGYVVVDRVVVVVMVGDAFVVRHQVRERPGTVGLRQATLHGETIHGQAEQQKDEDNPAQKFTLGNAAIIAAYTPTAMECFPARYLRGDRRGPLSRGWRCVNADRESIQADRLHRCRPPLATTVCLPAHDDEFDD